VNINPKDQAGIDAIIDVAERERSLRWWRIWLLVAALSLGAVSVSAFDVLPDIVRIGLFVAGALGIFLFVFFLSTKEPYGQSDFAGPGSLLSLLVGGWRKTRVSQSKRDT
jgi:hypothetical protein